MLCFGFLQSQDIDNHKIPAKHFFKKNIKSKPERFTDKKERAEREEMEEEEHEDMAYEMEHKKQFWFKEMQNPNADYFAVKDSFDLYFAQHRWEESRPREYGVSWIKSQIFYLDQNGRVQTPPPFDPALYPALPPLNPPGTTTRTVGTWHMLGPVNSTDYSNSGHGNRGGYVFLNRIDPTNAQKMFVSFVTGGLWMTSDGGVSWTLTDANRPNENYLDIDVAISDPSIVYAISSSGVIKSTDGGLSWAATGLTSTAFSGTAYDIAVSPADANIVIARWSNKIYRTTNGGTTWTQILTSLTNDYKVSDCSVQSEMLDWSTTDNNVVYFLSTSNNNQVKVYRSGDSGASFSIMTTITLDPSANGQVIGWAKLFLPSNNATAIYVALGTGTDSYSHHAVQLYKIDNTTGAEIMKRVNMLNGLTDPTGLHHGDIAMDRSDENKLAYGTYLPNKVYFSTNNGVSFTASTTDLHSDIRSVDMKDNRVLEGSDGESELSTDGGVNYLPMTNTISNHELWGFGSAFKSDLVAIGANHGPCMVKESGYGYEWYNLTGADQGNTDVNPLDDRYIYSQGYSNYRYFRTGLHTFVNESNFLDEGGIYAYFNNFEFHPNLYYTILSHHAGQYPTGNANLNTWKNSLIRSDDNGASISIVKTFSAQLFREKICMTNPNIIYAVVGLTNNKVWKTTDGGTNWTDVTPSPVASSGQTNISDIAIGDADPDQVWITYSGVQTACKVLKSSNGGTSWSPVGTQTTLTSNPVTKIIFQRGSDGGVYVGNKSGIYYKNNTMSNWVMLGSGLPQLEVRNMFINYNLGKLRIGTSRGSWEHDLYETSPPMAQISASTKEVVCPVADVVQFKDYSTVRNASATWSWSFPGGTPASSTLENPAVSYSGAPDGYYSVSLTVTDAYGTSSQTLTDFIHVQSQCGSLQPDTIPGNALQLVANTDRASIPAMNITTNNITLSCWIKPNGVQSGNAGLIFSASNNATGMSYNGTGLLGYTWRDEPGSYSYNSGLTIPVNVWSHVALVVTPTTATLYLNGVKATRTATHTAVTFSSPFLIGSDRNNNSRNFKGLIDEVCVYNRSLSEQEIQELMNLTRNHTLTDSTLISYFQMNEQSGATLVNHGNGSHASLVSGASRTTSTAPVGSGTSQRISVTTGGLKDFSTPGVELTFPASGTYPNGNIVVTKLNVPSDQLASPAVLPDSPRGYYIIRNYGTNSTFSALSSIKFKNVKGTTATTVAIPSRLTLYKRGANADGAIWATPIDSADVVTNSSGTGTVLFSTGLTNSTSFGQFSIGVDTSCVQNTYYADNDGDGYGAGAVILSCTQPANTSTNNTDCNDGAGAIYPGATEICNANVDDDCDGLADNADPSVTGQTAYYADNDGDNYGAGTAVMSCTQPANTSTNNTDCNDGATAINPGATEICNSNVDDDCDGLADNADPSITGQDTYYADNDGDTYGAGAAILSCLQPANTSTNNTDCNDDVAAIHPGTAETCNSVDDNCDGQVDNNLSVCPTPTNLEVSNIGATSADFTWGGASCSISVGIWWHDILGTSGHITVNTNTATLTDLQPATTYTVNAMSNCDGSMSEMSNTVTFTTLNNVFTFYRDADGDTFGNPAMTTQAATAPSGYVSDNTDCNDAAAAIHPGATESCNTVDDNCNGQIDEGVSYTHYQDSDGDTFGNPAVSVSNCSSAAGAGYSNNNTDCNDSNAAIKPTAAEVCDNADNNCNGITDEIVTCPKPVGNAATAITSTSATISWTVSLCADSWKYRYRKQISAGVYGPYIGGGADGYIPSATSSVSLTGLEPNTTYQWDVVAICPTNISLQSAVKTFKTCTLITFYQDTDGDGYGNNAVSQTLECVATLEGYKTAGGDCNDNNAAIKPGAAEACNGIDDNCNSIVDDVTTCPTNVSKVASGIGSSTATIGWSSRACAISYQYRYRTYTSATVYGPWIGSSDVNGWISTPDTAVLLTGLTANTKYQYSMRNVCYNNFGTATGGKVFTTCTQYTYYQDADFDGKGRTTPTYVDCIASPPSGYVTNNEDCNDNESLAFTGALEVCGDNVDNDCNGNVDDATFYLDADGDGFGGAAITYTGCTPPSGYVPAGTDCNDASNTTYPEATELCDNMDNDCNGITDDVATCPKPVTSATTNITSNSATINWGAVSCAVNGYQYRIRFKVDGVFTPYGSFISTNSNTVDLTGLAPGTVYQYQVKTACYGVNKFSALSTSAIFTTLGTPLFSVNVSSDAPDLNVENGYEVAVFPNPSSGKFTAEINAEINGVNLEMVITDGLGRSLQQYKIVLQKGLNQQELDLSAYPDAIYYIELRSDKGNFHYPIVKSAH